MWPGLDMLWPTSVVEDEEWEPLLGGRKGKEMGSPSKLLEGIQPCQHLDFKPWDAYQVLGYKTVRQLFGLF